MPTGLCVLHKMAAYTRLQCKTSEIQLQKKDTSLYDMTVSFKTHIIDFVIVTTAMANVLAAT